MSPAPGFLLGCLGPAYVPRTKSVGLGTAQSGQKGFPRPFPKIPHRFMPNPKAKPPLLPERLVARLWRNRDRRRTLHTQDGRRVRVLYPGRPNGGPGPDFRDAVVQIEGSPPVRGDVEVHRQVAGWNQHGHQQDPRYSNVVLHVVQRSTREATTYRQDGHTVPVTELDSLDSGRQPLQEATRERNVDAPFSHLQRWRSLSREQLGQLLAQAGEQRFLISSTAFQASLGQEDAEELLYRGLLEALGYSRNREPFRELAQHLPWRMVRDTVRAVPRRSRVLAIRHLLLSAAGLPGETPALTEEALSSQWDPKSLHITPMEPSAWCFAGVRPVNQPRRRMEGAAALLANYLDTGLLPGFLPLVREASVAALSNALTAVEGQVTLIGNGRALDIAVNVVLPLLHAWGLLRGDRALASSCIHLYRKAPRLAENEITREMAALLPGLSNHAPSVAGTRQAGNHPQNMPEGAQPPLRRGALQQQGLMHLYQVLLEDVDPRAGRALHP